ncbi:MAG TPA: hypothetical protein PKH23_06575, partial [Bacillota bacterium]|nr:hypothetical protein [Bacillota bacterium]
AYYKYRKAIRSTSSGVEGRMITIIIVIENLSHSLTRCLEVLLESDVSLMSLHQSIPIRGLAHVLVTFRSDDMNMPLDRLISLIAQTRGVLSVQILTPQP